MENKEKILSCKDLTINFRSDYGYVQAVRGISFDLYKGETLCIVGESGSGKSVSCKTIMGILANNAVIKNGSIMFEGKDLTKISEREFQTIRGNKIAMIFQDPLSALNPIIRIGKQITEAMLINKDRLKIRYENLILPEVAKLNQVQSKIIEAQSKVKSYNKQKEDVKKYKINQKVKIEQLIADKQEELIRQNLPKNEILASLKEYKKELYTKLDKDVKDKLYSIKEEHISNKKELKTVKSENKAALLQAKKELKEKSKVAKKEVLQFKKEALKFYHEERIKIENKYPSVKEIDSNISNAKKNYDSKILELNSLKEKELETLKNDHEIETIKLENEVSKINAKYEELILKAKAEILEPALKVKEDRKKELEENFYKNYCEKIKYTKGYAKARAMSVMKEVGIPQVEKRFKQYPFEFSGGMRQRIVIAIALVTNPDILICDEPTTALDVTIQAQILELINKLKKERNLSCIFITHDMGVVAEMADRIAVMYAGKIVEYGTSYDIFYDPRHPYTWALLSSIPDVDSSEKLEAIPGTPPNMNFPPEGDAFALRSKYALGIDFKKMPPFFKISDTHYAATWLLDPRAPKTQMPKIVSTRIENSLKKAGVSYETLQQESK